MRKDIYPYFVQSHGNDYEVEIFTYLHKIDIFRNPHNKLDVLNPDM